MSELIPGLKHLAGGKKQNWINNNMELIASLNEAIGFNETAKHLHMTPATLARALERQEKYSRPVITKAEKALANANLNKYKIDNLTGMIERQIKSFETHCEDDLQLREQLGQYFGMMAAANALMQELVTGVKKSLTLRNIYSRADKRKVGLTRLNPRGRLLLCHGPGLRQLPGPAIRVTNHHRVSKRGRGRRRYGV